MINIKYKQILTPTALLLPLLAVLIACSDTSTEQTSEKLKPVFAEKITAITVTPENWPKQASPIKRSPEQEAKIAEILAKMTVEEKVGQVIQGDIGSVTPDEAREYNLGSVLNGGNSGPNNDNRAAPQEWLKLADEFYQASIDTSDGGVGIPLLWGIDAVHGNNNVVGATIFPHNIGLGAANDPELIHKIGEITAKEILVVGLDWTFAPTLAVVRNDKWGRTYESYSENPEIVAVTLGLWLKAFREK